MAIAPTSIRALRAPVEQLEERSLMSSAAATGGGPPDWAIANGAREERTASLSSPEEAQAGEGGDQSTGNGPGQSATDQTAGGGTDNSAGADSDPTAKASDKTGTAPPDAAATPATPGTAHATTTPSVAVHTAAGETSGAGERKQAEAFWLPPGAHSTGDASASVTSPALDSHHVLLGSPGDSGGRLSGLLTARESGAMWAAGGAADQSSDDARTNSSAAESGTPSVSDMGEAVANLLPGIVVDAGTDLVAVGAGVLDRFSPPQVLEDVTLTVEQIAVRLAGEPEGESGDGWEAWTVAAGLAAASVELARRQFRRRSARSTRPTWNWGVCDVF